MAGSSSFNYQKGSPFFAAEDDVDDAEFLRPAARNSNNSTSTMEERRQQLLYEKTKIEERTIQSSMRSISLLNESEEIGIKTAEELATQREQLQNTEQKLDEINSALRISQRHIQGIKSVFGSIKNYFSAPPKPLPSVKEEKKDEAKQNGTSANESLRAAVSPTSTTATSPGTSPTDGYRRNVPRDRSVDDILDDNLGIMGDSLKRLKGLGLTLQTEIDDSNQLVERIIGKTENVDHRIQGQSQQMNKILKK